MGDQYIMGYNPCNEIFLSDDRITTGPISFKITKTPYLEELKPLGEYKPIDERIKNTKKKQNKK